MEFRVEGGSVRVADLRFNPKPVRGNTWNEIHKAKYGTERPSFRQASIEEIWRLIVGAYRGLESPNKATKKCAEEIIGVFEDSCVISSNVAFNFQDMSYLFRNPLIDERGEIIPVKEEIMYGIFRNRNGNQSLVRRMVLSNAQNPEVFVNFIAGEREYVEYQKLLEMSRKEGNLQLTPSPNQIEFPMITLEEELSLGFLDVQKDWELSSFGVQKVFPYVK